MLTAGTNLNDLSSAEANAACDTALTDYDGPTKTEMDTGHGLLATEAKQDVIDGIVDDIKAAKILLKTTIGSDGRSSTSCRLDAGSDNDNSYIGARVILHEDGAASAFVGRTVTDFAETNKQITWSPAIAEDAEDGG